jgi:PilZ domain
MSTREVHLERRAAQRFGFHLPVALGLAGSERRGHGFTQDVSARGALLYTDFALTPGDRVELTLVMPAEITLAENMPLRCRGRAIRVVELDHRFAIAFHFDEYQYLPPDQSAGESQANFQRISALHPRRQEQKDGRPPVASGLTS